MIHGGFMVVISHAFVSYPGHFIPIAIAYGNVETASKGLRREFRDEVVQVSEGLFTYKGSMIKITHVPFIDLLFLRNLGQLLRIIHEIQANPPK